MVEETPAVKTQVCWAAIMVVLCVLFLVFPLPDLAAALGPRLALPRQPGSLGLGLEVSARLGLALGLDIRCRGCGMLRHQVHLKKYQA